MPPTAGASLSALEMISADHDSASSLITAKFAYYEQRKGAGQAKRTDARPAKLAAMPRIVIDRVAPVVDGARFAAKRVIGEPVIVEADVFSDGHEPSS